MRRSCFLLKSKCESTFKMDLATWKLMTFILFVTLAVCLAQKSYTINVAVGQNVSMGCGVQSKGVFERLVWISGDVNSTEWLAYSYDGSKSCDKRIKENCDLSSDGSLELQNVQKMDSGVYFCVLDLEEKYYSQHPLVVHPEVAFETHPNPEDVFVTQAGPDEMVLAYTNPVCKNTDVTGIVTCDPPSGVKIGMDVTNIVCTCTHAGNVVDTCEIPIPQADVSPSSQNCSESAPSGSKAVGITCPHLTALGIVLSIIGAVLGVAVTLTVVALLKKKQNRKRLTDVEGNPHESCKLMSPTAKSEKCKCNDLPTSGEGNEEQMKPEFTTHLQTQMTVICGGRLELNCSVTGYPKPFILWYKDGKQLDPQAGYKTTFSEGVAMLIAESINEGDQGMFSCVVVSPEGDDDITSCNVLVEKTATVQPSDTNGTPAEVHSVVTDSGFPCTNPDETGIAEVDTPDSNNQKDTQRNIPSCREIREFVVEDVSGKFRILPSRTNPTGGIAISCNRDENLTVEFHKGDLSTLPKPSLDPFNGGMAISVADTLAVPVDINCLKCGNSCCTLEVNGGEWSKKQPETDCKITCKEKDADEI